MKKTLLIVMGAALMLGVSSCQKEGVYTPKKKIAAVYLESKTTTTLLGSNTSTVTNNEKRKKEDWIWDGKLLKEVKHYNNDGEIASTTTYTYDKKRVVRIENKSSDVTSYSTFEYDGKWLKSSEFYYDGRLRNSYVYTHTDKKITSIEHTSYSYGLDRKAAAEMDAIYAEMVAPIGIMIPEGTKCEGAKGQVELTSTVELKWDGNNIAYKTTTNSGSSSTVGFTYDDKKNPYYGMFEEDFFCAPGLVSENNLMSTTESDSPKMSYTYDGKYPVTQTIKTITTSIAGTMEIEMTYTFEYK